MWLNKLIHRVKQRSDSSSPKETKPADMSFYVKRINDALYEVSLKDFPASKGLGTNPQQALNDLLESLNQQIDSVVKQTVLMNMHKDEISEKYCDLLEHFNKNHSKEKPTSWIKKIKQYFSPPPRTIQVLEVSIALKEPDITRSIMDRLIPKELPFANLSRLSMMPSMMMRQEPRILSTPNIPELEHRFLLRSNYDQTEPPLNLIFDSEGFELEETFSFGIVVNLN